VKRVQCIVCETLRYHGRTAMSGLVSPAGEQIERALKLIPED